jgi:two-component sensor histidine kinase
MNMMTPIGDLALNFPVHVHYGQPSTLQSMPRFWGDVTPARSRFERLAQLAQGLPTEPGDLLGALLTGTLPVNHRGCEVLRPLWAEEAVHRAYTLMRLVDLRNRRGHHADRAAMIIRLEDAIARDLAIQFRELEAGRERDVMPCSAVLRGVVTGLGTLFGCPADIVLTTEIEELLLPAYKRRALVLATAELVGNALLHAFPGRESGRIDVGLTVHDVELVRLRVADDGVGFAGASPNLECGVAAGLADLLETGFGYKRTAGRTIAEIVFPLTAR